MITPTGRIEGTRITVYDVLDYVRANHHHTYTAIMLQISSDEVGAAIQFIENNRAEVMRNYREMLARDAQGNPPEIRAKLRKSHAKLKALLSGKIRLPPRTDSIAESQTKLRTELRTALKSSRDSKATGAKTPPPKSPKSSNEKHRARNHRG